MYNTALILLLLFFTSFSSGQHAARASTASSLTLVARTFKFRRVFPHPCARLTTALEDKR
jgi:hypothetical protein